MRRLQFVWLARTEQAGYFGLMGERPDAHGLIPLPIPGISNPIALAPGELFLVRRNPYQSDDARLSNEGRDCPSKHFALILMSEAQLIRDLKARQ